MKKREYLVKLISLAEHFEGFVGIGTLGLIVTVLISRKSETAAGFAIMLAISMTSLCVVGVASEILSYMSLDNAVLSDHGDDLATVIEALREESFEYRAIFDEHGNKLAEGTLFSPCACNVAQPDWEKIKYAHTEIHNHPGIDDLAFSGQDLKIMMFEYNYQNIVVTRNFTYTIENPYWQGNDTQYPFDEREFNTFVDRKMFFCKLIVKSVGAFSRTLGRWSSTYTVYRIAHHFGLKFHVQDHRLERLKENLWTRQVQQGIARYAIALGMTAMMFIPAVPKVSATSIVTSNTYDVKTVTTQKFAYDDNKSEVLEFGNCASTDSPTDEGDADIGGGLNRESINIGGCVRPF